MLRMVSVCLFVILLLPTVLQADDNVARAGFVGPNSVWTSLDGDRDTILVTGDSNYVSQSLETIRNVGLELAGYGGAVGIACPDDEQSILGVSGLINYGTDASGVATEFKEASMGNTNAWVIYCAEDPEDTDGVVDVYVDIGALGQATDASLTFDFEISLANASINATGMVVNDGGALYMTGLGAFGIEDIEMGNISTDFTILDCGCSFVLTGVEVGTVVTITASAQVGLPAGTSVPGGGDPGGPIDEGMTTMLGGRGGNFSPCTSCDDYYMVGQLEYDCTVLFSEIYYPED